MAYMIETWDKPGTLEKRARLRPGHLEFLDRNAKLLIACGAKLDDAGNPAGGGLYVVDVETRAEAEAFIASDPFHQGGLFERVNICRWRKAFVDGRRMI
jgi:uncharacterized protein YciI